MSKETPTVKSVERALDLLEQLAMNENGQSLSQLAANNDLNPNTVRSLVRTLQKRGYVKQEHPRGRYSIGDAFLRYRNPLDESQSLTNLVFPKLLELNQSTNGESVFCSRVAGEYLWPIARIDSNHTLTVQPSVFVPQMLHVLAQGKIVLASWPDDKVKLFVQSTRLLKLGPNALTEYDELIHELEKIRSTGVAYSIDEVGQGLSGVAVGIHNEHGELVITLAYGLPTLRLSPAQKVEMPKYLLDVAKDLAGEIAIRKLAKLQRR